jgi:hypothetical protein
MARIPRADNFQVVPGVRQGRAQAVLSPDQASLPGRRMMAQGEQLMQIGGAVERYALQQQEKLNTAQAQDALRQAERQALGLRMQMEELKGAQAAQGIDGTPLGLYFDTELGRGIEEIARNIPSQVARERFMMEAAGLRSRFAERAMLYEAQQADVYLQQNLDAEIAHQNDLLIGESSDPAAMFDRLSKVREAYTAKLREAGYTGDALEQEVRKEMSKTHVIVMTHYSENQKNYEAAQTYFELNREDFTALDAAKMQTALDTQGMELRVIGTADQLMNKTKRDYGAAIIEARKISDPEERTKVEARLATMKAQDDAAKSAKDADDLETGMSYVVQGASIPASWYAEASPLVIDRIQKEQQERADRARAQAGRTAEEKAAAKQTSLFNYNILKLQASNPEFAQLGFEGLLADPDLQLLYDNMEDEERNKLIADVNGARRNVPVDAVTKATKDILAVSGAMLPPNLKPNAIAGLGRADIGERFISANQVKSPLALRTEGALLGLVEAELTRTNGAPINNERARQLFGLALAEAGGLTNKGVPKYAPPAEVIMEQAALDRQRAILDFRKENPDIWRAATFVARQANPSATDVDIFAEAEQLRSQVNRTKAARNWGAFGEQMARTFTGRAGTEVTE